MRKCDCAYMRDARTACPACVEVERVTREAVVGEARRWVGTPYRHQARLIGVACDCAGLIIGTGIAAGVMDYSDAKFRPFRNYGRTPNPAHMRKALETFLEPVAQGGERPGDIAWMQWRDALPMHLGILAAVADVPRHDLAKEWGCDVMESRPTLIHATNEIGRVVEHGFAAPWPDRVNSWWRFPGVAAAVVRGGQ